MVFIWFLLRILIIKWFQYVVFQMGHSIEPPYYYSWGSDSRTYWTHYREQHVLLESSDSRDICNQRNFLNQYYHVWNSVSEVGNPISSSLTPLFVRNPCEFLLYWNYGHDMKPIAWYSYRVRIKFSLVLLAMFSYPYPTLVQSYPHPYSHLGKPIVLSGKPEMSFYLDTGDAWKGQNLKKFWFRDNDFKKRIWLSLSLSFW